MRLNYFLGLVHSWFSLILTNWCTLLCGKFYKLQFVSSVFMEVILCLWLDIGFVCSYIPYLVPFYAGSTFHYQFMFQVKRFMKVFLFLMLVKEWLLHHGINWKMSIFKHFWRSIVNLIFWKKNISGWMLPLSSLREVVWDPLILVIVDETGCICTVHS